MDARFRLFCRIGNNDYNDWTLIWYNTPYYIERRKDIGQIVAFDGDYFEQFKNAKGSLFDETFIPQHGSEIHLVPGCPVGVADVRKNYALKRKPDDGCCNVFSPYNGDWSTVWNTEYAIVAKEKTIVVCEKNKYISNAKGVDFALIKLFPDITSHEYMIYHKDLPLFCANLSAAYISLMKGTLRKPCISLDKLEFKSDNKVNIDILYLVYKTGMERWSADAQKAFHIQLCALNEHDWRNYPGTMSILMNDILYSKRHNSGRVLDDLGSVSRLPKACKELVRSGNQSGIPFKSQEDMEMAQQLILCVLCLKDRQSTSIQELANVFNKNKINMNCFYRTFDNIVKFRPKEFKNEES